MGYTACNEVLHQILADSAGKPGHELVQVPWLPNGGLNGTGRVGAVAAISDGLLGVAKNASGHHKLYHGANHAGNWFFEVWSVWKAAAFFVVLLHAGFWSFSYRDHMVAQLVLVVVGLLGVLVFVGRAKNIAHHWAVASAAGESKYYAGIVPSAVGCATGVGFFIAGCVLLSGGNLGSPGEQIKGSDLLSLQFAGLMVRNVVLWFAIIVVASKVIWNIVLGKPSLWAVSSRVQETSYHTNEMYDAAERSGLVEESWRGGKTGNGLLFFVFFGLLIFFAVWPLVLKA